MSGAAKARRGLCGRNRDDFEQFQFWRDQGLSVRAASAAAASGCRSVRELRQLGWRYFEYQANCGAKTLRELSAHVGGFPDALGRDATFIGRALDTALVKDLRRRGYAVVSGDS
jgi:hypothetical protein